MVAVVHGISLQLLVEHEHGTHSNDEDEDDNIYYLFGTPFGT